MNEALQDLHDLEGRTADAPKPRRVLDISDARHNFAWALKHAQLPGFRLYDLRHTFATLLLAKGVPITYVAAQLGHAKPTTTLQWYSHWLPRADQNRYVDGLDGGS